MRMRYLVLLLIYIISASCVQQITADEDIECNDPTLNDSSESWFSEFFPPPEVDDDEVGTTTNGNSKLKSLGGGLCVGKRKNLIETFVSFVEMLVSWFWKQVLKDVNMPGSYRTDMPTLTVIKRVGENNQHRNELYNKLTQVYKRLEEAISDTDSGTHDDNTSTSDRVTSLKKAEDTSKSEVVISPWDWVPATIYLLNSIKQYVVPSELYSELPKLYSEWPSSTSWCLVPSSEWLVSPSAWLSSQIKLLVLPLEYAQSGLTWLMSRLLEYLSSLTASLAMPFVDLQKWSETLSPLSTRLPSISTVQNAMSTEHMSLFAWLTSTTIGVMLQLLTLASSVTWMVLIRYGLAISIAVFGIKYFNARAYTGRITGGRLSNPRRHSGRHSRETAPVVASVPSQESNEDGGEFYDAMAVVTYGEGGDTESRMSTSVVEVARPPSCVHPTAKPQCIASLAGKPCAYSTKRSQVCEYIRDLPIKETSTPSSTTSINISEMAGDGVFADAQKLYQANAIRMRLITDRNTSKRAKSPRHATISPRALQLLARSDLVAPIEPIAGKDFTMKHDDDLDLTMELEVLDDQIRSIKDDLDESIISDIGLPRFNSSFRDDLQQLSPGVGRSRIDTKAGGDRSAILTKRCPYTEVGISFLEGTPSSDKTASFQQPRGLLNASNASFNDTMSSFQESSMFEIGMGFMLKKMLGLSLLYIGYKSGEWNVLGVPKNRDKKTRPNLYLVQSKKRSSPRKQRLTSHSRNNSADPPKFSSFLCGSLKGSMSFEEYSVTPRAASARKSKSDPNTSTSGSSLETSSEGSDSDSGSHLKFYQKTN